MNNRMIADEQKGISSSSSLWISSLMPFRNTNERTFHPKAIMTRIWFNFCEENHDENITCEVKINARDNIFGKGTDTTIVVLDWVEPEDDMVVNTRNKYYTAKSKFDPPHTSSAPSSSFQSVDAQVVGTSSNQGVSSPLPSSKYNTLNQLDNIKVDDTLLDMVVIPEQHKHIKEFIEGKISTIANLFEYSKEEDSTVNGIGVNNFRNPVKIPPFYISLKIMDKISHCFLIDGGSGPSVMYKIIMEEIGLSCPNENSRSMLSYNNLQQSTIGEIKYVTLVLCVHPKIRTTLNIQVINIPVSNYSIILGRDWQALTSGYLSLDGTHLSVRRNRKSIIVLREGRISPYIESIPQPNVKYLEEDLGV
jgi:hypothetical protein